MTELAQGLEIKLVDISYHCAVLGDSGKLDRRRRSDRFLVESLVAEDPEVESTLADTAAEDDPNAGQVR